MAFIQHQIPTLRRHLRDVEHDLCVVLVVASSNNSGYYYAVCEANSGEIIAWDGMFSGDGPAPASSLVDADWDDWDDMASKLLINTQSQWASDRMTFWLMPTFSPARAAGRLVRGWEAKNDNTNQDVARGRVLAYLPIVDRDVFEAARAGSIIG